MKRLILSPLFLMIGCVTGGQVTARVPIETPVKGYRTAAFTVKAADPSMTNAALHTKNLRGIVSAKLHGSGLFDSVYGEDQTDQAKLLFKVQLLEVVDGSKDLMSRGISSVKLEVDIFDRAQGQSIGLLDIEGTSETGTKHTIGGVDMDAFEETIKRAMERAGDHLVDYLKSIDG